ncbi:MAG TPA: class I SAM-dependent methyltransferase [Candidatus Eisenbacteria bacterium]|nr:class I SAM-dependent methyltransferase [Candidatus Eisenbacteria bacterium]
MAPYRASSLPAESSAETFKITDSQYGVTGALWRCPACGFLECPEMSGVLAFYEALEDPAYEESRPARQIQERRLLEAVRRLRPNGRLLDVGAASGALVEQAAGLGYEAEGVEPSRWLREKAAARGLRVHLGTLPHPDARGPFDVVTLVDVLEHIPRPIAVLEEIRRVLAPGGLVAVATPDASSVAARVFGRRWWHFRAGHVGYFNLRNLDLLFGRAGFRRVGWQRPSWYFGLDYLASRLKRYFPFPGRMPAFFRKVIVPVNLGDSLLVFYVQKGTPA